MVTTLRPFKDAAVPTATTYLGPDPRRIVSAVAKRQRRIDCIAAKLRVLLTPEDQERLLARIEEAETPPPASEADVALATALSSGYTATPSQRAADETAVLIEYFRYRHTLLEGALSASDVAAALGTTRQTPHDRLRRGALLAIMDRGVWRFPPWQFDPAGPDGVVRGLPQVLRALQHLSPLGRASWLTSPNPVLDGMTPLAALKCGEAERVMTEARGVGTH